MPLKKKFLLNFLLLPFTFLTLSTVYGQTTASLLKTAEEVYEKNPDQGILSANIAHRYAVIRKQKPEELKSLLLISNFYWDLRDYTKARKTVEAGLKLALNYKIDSLTGSLYNMMGLITYSEGSYRKAIENYQQSIVYLSRSGLEKKVGIAYMNLGMCEKKLSAFDLANSSYFKAAEIFQKFGDTENVCGVYNSIGNCFSSQGNYKNAVRYHDMASKMVLKLGDQVLTAQCFNNLGYSYLMYSKPDSAIKYLYKCMEIRKTERDSGLMVLTMQNLGVAFKQKGLLKPAYFYILSAIRIAEKLDMKDELAWGLLDLAELYLQEKKIVSALDAINKSEKLAQDLGSPELLKEIYGIKSRLLEQDGKYSQALFYEKKRNQISDSLTNLAKTVAISEVEVKYETKQKDKDIKNLHAKGILERKVVRQQGYSILALIIAIVLMLLLLFLALRSYHQKTKDNLRIQNLMKELHHRVKNNLQILSGLFTLQLAETGNEQVKTSIRDNEMRLNAMNLIHQKLYVNEIDTKIDIKEYLEELTKNIEISFGRNLNGISMVVDVEPLFIEAEKVVSLGLIVNELATNAYKYAFTPAGGEIYVGLKRAGEKMIILTIKDNGRGKEPKYNRPEKNSFGLKLVNLLARQLNAKMLVGFANGFSYQLEMELTV